MIEESSLLKKGTRRTEIISNDVIFSLNVNAKLFLESFLWKKFRRNQYKQKNTSWRQNYGKANINVSFESQFNILKNLFSPENKNTKSYINCDSNNEGAFQTK